MYGSTFPKAILDRLLIVFAGETTLDRDAPVWTRDETRPPEGHKDAVPLR